MDKEYLLHERPLRALLVFAFPILIGNLFQQFYTMADSVIVGRFVSENALAAVGASYSLTNVFISVAVGGGMGAAVITSQTFGQRDYRRMKRSIATALLSFLMLSLVLSAFGLVFCRQIMDLLQTPSNILDDATAYLQIYFLGLPFLFMYNVLSAMFNALGRSKIPLGLLIFSSVLNILLDLYMVCVLGLGVTGVAWATLIAQGVSALASFVIFLRTIRNYAIPHPYRFDLSELRQMVRIALPTILQQSTVSIGMMLVQSVVNRFGAEVLAGYSAAVRIENICFVPMVAMGNAIASYTAQNLGANQIDRIRQGYRLSYRVIACFAVILCVILQVAYRPLITLFLGEDGTPAALQTGMNYTWFISWFFVLLGCKMITDGVLRGAGDMPVFTLANLVNLGLRVLIAVCLAPRFGVALVWYAVPIGWLANYLISLAEYRTGKWKTILKKTA